MFCELFFVRESKREDFFYVLQQRIRHQVARLTPKKCSAPSGYIEENVTANQHISLVLRDCSQFTESSESPPGKQSNRGLFMVNKCQQSSGGSVRMFLPPDRLLPTVYQV